uniref:Uncharacterized protein n=1 Tax=Chrysemys picta bellii TaxID=8478 RepID=A0A8C3H616_CHRPI
FIEYQGWKRPQEVSSPTPVTDSLSSLSTNNKATTADTASMDSTKANNFLMEIMGALQTLLAQNAVLQAQAMPSSGPNPTPCESKLPLPDKFNGDCRNFATWDGLPTVFTREALVWASPLLEKASPLLGQFEDFVLAMVVIVNDPITSLQLKLYFRCCIRKADQLLNVQRIHLCIKINAQQTKHHQEKKVVLPAPAIPAEPSPHITSSFFITQTHAS